MHDLADQAFVLVRAKNRLKAGGRVVMPVTFAAAADFSGRETVVEISAGD